MALLVLLLLISELVLGTAYLNRDAKDRIQDKPAVLAKGSAHASFLDLEPDWSSFLDNSASSALDGDDGAEKNSNDAEVEQRRRKEEEARGTALGTKIIQDSEKEEKRKKADAAAAKEKQKRL